MCCAPAVEEVAEDFGRLRLNGLVAALLTLLKPTRELKSVALQRSDAWAGAT